MPSEVPQSASLTMTSWLTSTSLLVKYPESAVLRAVSVKPLRAPVADRKNSRTERPSRKFDLTGTSTVFPMALAIRPRIPASCFIWLRPPRAPDTDII